MITMPALFAMIFVFYPNWVEIASGLPSEIEFTAAHEKITLWAWTNVLALLIDQPGVTERAVIPPVFFFCRFCRERLNFLLQTSLREVSLRR